jgi:hypothetical protein
MFKTGFLDFTILRLSGEHLSGIKRLRKAQKAVKDAAQAV